MHSKIYMYLARFAKTKYNLERSTSHDKKKQFIKKNSLALLAGKYDRTSPIYIMRRTA